MELTLQPQPRTVLIVDDDQELVDGLRIVLERQGYRVIRASNGIQGKQAIYNQRPDLVILDMMMPQMGGYPVLEHFRDEVGGVDERMPFRGGSRCEPLEQPAGPLDADLDGGVLGFADDVNGREENVHRRRLGAAQPRIELAHRNAQSLAQLALAAKGGSGPSQDRVSEGGNRDLFSKVSLRAGRSDGRARRAASPAANGSSASRSSNSSTRSARRGVRTIVHLVAIVAGAPATFERVMAAGTGNLVEAARESGVRRIVLMSALGTGPGATVPYFRAKWAAEQAVASSGVDHAVLRPSFVFGTDGGALPRFLKIARLSPVTPVIGPGTQRVQPIWIDDLVRAVRLASEADGTFEPIELGGPEAVTWSELWRRIKTALGTRRPAVHVPFWLARGPAALFERLPPALLTRDQLRMLEGPDNVVGDGGASMRALGLGDLVSLDEQLRRAAAAHPR